MNAEELKKEVQEAVEPIAAKMKEIRAELDKLAERGEDSQGVKVKDLEARLIELEQQVRDAKASFEQPKEKGTDAEVERYFMARAALAAQKNGTDTPLTRFFGSADLASAGKLNPEQADRFLDYVMNETVLLGMIDGASTNSDTVYLDEIGISRRQLRVVNEGVSVTPRNAISTARRVLTVKEVSWAEDISRSALEDNIERGQLQNTVTRLLARAFGNDVEDLSLNGDTSLPASITDANSDGKDDNTGLTANDNEFLRQMDGYIHIAAGDSDVHAVDAGSLTDVKAVLRAMLRGMPARYRGMGLTYFLDPDTALAYADMVADRQTGVGDETLINGFPVLRFYGYRVIGAPYLKHERSDTGRKAILTAPENLVIRFRRNMTFDAKWEPRPRLVEFTLTARFGIQYKKSDLLVLADNVKDF